MQKPNAMEDFRRNIAYRVLKLHDGHVSLTATLEDAYHDIAVQVIVDENTLVITCATADLRRAPSPECAAVSARMAQLNGVLIGKGLEWKLKKIFGCRSGCGNIHNLLLGLLPLALNYKASAGISDEQDMLKAVHERLLGTCAGYATPLPEEENPHE